MKKQEWTEEDALRWDEICSKVPEELTIEEKAEGLKLAKRAFEFLLKDKNET